MRDTSNALIFVAKLPLDQWIRYGGQLEKNEMAVFFRVGVPEYLVRIMSFRKQVAVNFHQLYP